MRTALVPIALGALVSCEKGASELPSMPSAPLAASTQYRSASPHVSGTSGAPFVRVRPPVFALRSVDACAYASEPDRACVDAMVDEPAEVRVRYMRRLSDAYTRLSRDRGHSALGDTEIAECCNAAGPCGATKKSGHADCPRMDDGYACLTAAELHVPTSTKEASAFHERACRCDWTRAQIPVIGGLLACDGRDRPVKRGAAMDEHEAREVAMCGACDPNDGPAACAAEIARQRSRDVELAHYIEKVHVTRCQLP